MWVTWNIRYLMSQKPTEKHLKSYSVGVASCRWSDHIGEECHAVFYEPVVFEDRTRFVVVVEAKVVVLPQGEPVEGDTGGIGNSVFGEVAHACVTKTMTEIIKSWRLVYVYVYVASVLCPVNNEDPKEKVGRLFGLLTSSSATRLYRGWVSRLKSYKFTCCHTETELGVHDFCLSRSHYTDTDPTSGGRAVTARIEPTSSSSGVACCTDWATASPKGKTGIVVVNLKFVNDPPPPPPQRKKKKRAFTKLKSTTTRKTHGDLQKTPPPPPQFNLNTLWFVGEFYNHSPLFLPLTQSHAPVINIAVPFLKSLSRRIY